MRLRRIVWGTIDVVLLAMCVAATVLLPFKPVSQAPEHLVFPLVRLTITALFALRVGIRLLPHLLNMIERVDVRALVAARHLRAPKSNSFLGAISLLSLLAVSFSSCALTTTLSVMGGFRNDLKDKILGNHAHIVVGSKEGDIENWQGIDKTLRGVEGVKGVSPYLGGEVMMTSASNLAGVVLRGIDIGAIGEVSDLPTNIEAGKLEHLQHPERIEAPKADDGLTMPMKPMLGAAKRLDSAPSGQDLDEVEPGDAELPEDADIFADMKRKEPSDSATGSVAQETLPAIVVGRELARVLRLAVADEVQLVAPFGGLGPSGPVPKTRSFQVAGIFYSGMYEYDMKYVYADLETAQAFLGKPDVISGFEIKTGNVEHAPTLATAVKSTLKRSGHTLKVQDWKQLNQNLFGALALEKIAMFVTLGIAVLVAGFCVFGTLTLMVQEKTRDVAILKAIGASRRVIVSIFLSEGLLLGIFGATLGTGFGFVACYLAQHFGIHLDPEVYYIDRLPVHIDTLEFVMVALSAILVCVLATLFPAFIASAQKPAEALRYE